MKTIKEGGLVTEAAKQLNTMKRRLAEMAGIAWHDHYTTVKVGGTGQYAVSVKVGYSLSGAYRPATWDEPEEHPEIEIKEMVPNLALLDTLNDEERADIMEYLNSEDFANDVYNAVEKQVLDAGYRSNDD